MPKEKKSAPRKKPAKAKRAASGKAGKKEKKAAPKARQGAAKRQEKREKAPKEGGKKKETVGGAAKAGRGRKPIGRARPKSPEAKRVAVRIKKKKRHLFRGRFGKRSVRRKSKKKWQRWRKPRGIDIYRNKEDGLYPKSGYRTSRGIRGIHPSGYAVALVRNRAELLDAAERKNTAALLAKTIGKRKRALLLEEAKRLGLVVLNG
jgi:large subunit ribosomal protein L32e